MSMNYLHYELDAGPDDVVEVTLDHAANVQLLDAANYNAYRNGQSFRYHGGHVTASPYSLRPPHHDHWHVVIDLGGSPGTVRAAVRVIGGVTA
jgi:alkanesulfonate monooxygenase SsuD/methylene tetrahydromethanopterin reductase-like flavin-dependent oxidoreductase (luciferase family)